MSWHMQPRRLGAGHPSCIDCTRRMVADVQLRPLFTLGVRRMAAVCAALAVVFCDA